MNAAKVLDFEQAKAPEEGRVLMPEVLTNLTGDPRTIAVAKFRELADKIESGELDGARIQWPHARSENQMQFVTLDTKKVQFITATIEEEG